MNHPDNSDLLRKSKDQLAKFDRLQASGDAIGVEQVRKEMAQTHAQLSREIDGNRAVELIKAAQTAPKSFYETSPGAAMAEGQSAGVVASGDALPDGSLRIRDRAELKAAVVAFRLGRTKDSVAAEKHILRRASELAMMDEVPNDMRSQAKMAGGAYSPLRKDGIGRSR